VSGGKTQKKYKRSQEKVEPNTLRRDENKKRAGDAVNKRASAKKKKTV